MTENLSTRKSPKQIADALIQRVSEQSRKTVGQTGGAPIQSAVTIERVPKVCVEANSVVKKGRFLRMLDGLFPSKVELI